MLQTLLFFGIGSGSFGFGQEQIAVHHVDLRFMEQVSLIQAPTTTDARAYFNDVVDPKKHLPFADTAVLDFGGRQIRVFLVASKHDGGADQRFIAEQIMRFGPAKNARLFVEQGDPFADEGAVTQITQGARERFPALLPDLERAAHARTSILNPEFSKSNPFAIAARGWHATGAQVLNFDVAMNFSKDAVQFLVANVGLETAARFLREEIHGATLSFLHFRRLFESLFPEIFHDGRISSFGDCCASLRTWSGSVAGDIPLRDHVRERYMKKILFENAHDGDVILTHPVHMDHLLNPEAFETFPSRRTL